MTTITHTVVACVMTCALLGLGPWQPGGLKRVDPEIAGRLTGRAVFRGTPPPREVLDMSIDPVCVREAGPNAESEAVLIDRSGGLQNVFVYVKEGLDPAYTFATPMTPATMDQRKCQFSPRVIGVRVGQVLEVNNGDPTLHNVHGRAVANKEFNVGQPIQGMRFSRTFTVPEVMVPFTSDVHRWMAAFVGVLPHPFFAVTSPDGSFTITDVPPGSYTIEAWHEKFGKATQNATVGPRQTATVSFEFLLR
jgi:plastocyanin